ncbi:MAG: hypothetical protein V1804_02055 [Patescibacteria group bacterium]
MLKIPKQYASFEFIKPIKWNEVFDVWRKGEAWQESWKKHWREQGFDSWDEWREAYAVPLSPETLEWNLYEIRYPLKDFPLIYGVPSVSWIKKAYSGEKTKQLKEILDLPIIKDNLKILSIKKDFPKETMFTGIIYKDKIILVEGMHRASALAGWDKNNLLNSKIIIALANWDQKEIPTME